MVGEAEYRAQAGPTEPETYQLAEMDAPDELGGLKDTGWRTEILKNGTYYIWRKGSHGNRQSAPGGKFTRRTFGVGFDERRKDYERNKAVQRARLDTGGGAGVYGPNPD